MRYWSLLNEEPAGKHKPSGSLLLPEPDDEYGTPPPSRIQDQAAHPPPARPFSFLKSPKTFDLLPPKLLTVRSRVTVWAIAPI